MSSSNPFAQRDPSAYALPAGLADELQTPALVVYLDRVRANVQRVIELAGGADRWRPHLKTTKIPEVWAELLAAGVRVIDLSGAFRLRDTAAYPTFYNFTH